MKLQKFFKLSHSIDLMYGLTFSYILCQQKRVSISYVYLNNYYKFRRKSEMAIKGRFGHEQRRLLLQSVPAILQLHEPPIDRLPFLLLIIAWYSTRQIWIESASIKILDRLIREICILRGSKSLSWPWHEADGCHKAFVCVSKWVRRMLSSMRTIIRFLRMIWCTL